MSENLLMAERSIREFDSLADRIRLHHQGDPRKVVIVEGVSDRLALERAFTEDIAAYFIAGTRSIAIDSAKQLIMSGNDYFVCVVDRDFDDGVSLAGEQDTSLPLHPYGNADLEAMLTVCGAASDVLKEFGSEQKIASAGGISVVLQRIYSLIDPISILRRANHENHWGLAFDKVDLASKIDRVSFALKAQSYCAALSETSDMSPGQEILLAYVNGNKVPKEMPVCPRGSTPYFRGRDFVEAMSVALRKYCGSKSAQSVEPEHLTSVLRLAGRVHLREGSWGIEFLQYISGQN